MSLLGDERHGPFYFRCAGGPMRNLASKNMSDGQRASGVRLGSTPNLANSGVATAVRRVFALYQHGASGGQILTACEYLMSETERELLRRERIMMTSGNTELAAHVRRNSDILLKLGNEILQLRRGNKQLSPAFLRFAYSLLEYECRLERAPSPGALASS